MARDRGDWVATRLPDDRMVARSHGWITGSQTIAGSRRSQSHQEERHWISLPVAPRGSRSDSVGRITHGYRVQRSRPLGRPRSDCS